MQTIKDLTSFVANSTKYKILPIESALTLERYTAFESLKFQYSFDMSPETIGAKLEESNSIINGIVTGRDTKRNVLHAATILLGLVEVLKTPTRVSSSRLGYMMLICSLFIVKEDEDLSKWNEGEANLKIKDWVEEGLSAMDFFTLGIDAIRKLNSALMEAAIDNG